MNFYIYAGCELTDTIPILRAKFPEHNFYNIDTTTLGSLFSPLDLVAEKVDKWYHQSDAKK